MRFYILIIDGGYEADIVTPFPPDGEVLAAADRTITEPDPRGLMLEWEVNNGQPRPFKHSGFSYGHPRP